jgi:hypothetical protein
VVTDMPSKASSIRLGGARALGNWSRHVFDLGPRSRLALRDDNDADLLLPPARCPFRAFGSETCRARNLHGAARVRKMGNVQDRQSSWSHLITVDNEKNGGQRRLYAVLGHVALPWGIRDEHRPIEARPEGSIKPVADSECFFELRVIQLPIAVGTVIADRPPHRSRRALLTAGRVAARACDR